MANKKSNLEEKIDRKAENFEKLMEARAELIPQIIIRWLRTSQFFDGMVNTPARILINVMSLIALYGWTIDVINKERNMLAWVITLLVLLFMQGASVRFIFNTEGVADELQTAKRNEAYRRAYQAIGKIALIPVLLFGLLVLLSRSHDSNDLWSFAAYRLDNYRSLALAIFILAAISFQKYFSYGWIGEPFTQRKNGKIRD